MSPLANNEHQSLAFLLARVVGEVVPMSDGTIFVGCNVSDRMKRWEKNYRCPDVAAYLKGNPAQDCGTHWFGGPDWLAEILSEDDESRRKLEFYEKVAVREVLLIDRDPWGIELYQRHNEKLVLVGKSTLAEPSELKSFVLPLSFQLSTGITRPLVLVKHTDGARQWQV